MRVPAVGGAGPDAASGSALGAGRVEARRHPDGELAPLARPVAPDGGGAAVQLGEPADQRQPDALAALGLAARRGEVEGPGEHRGGDALAVIPDAEDDGILLPRDGDPDASPRVGGPGGVAEQADEDLLQPRRVRVERERARGRGEGELVMALVDQRADRGGRGAGGRGAVQPLAPQLDLPPGDAREVQQVVELTHQVPELPLHGVLGPGDVLRRGRPPRQVQGSADGGHRVAQVVREPAEELVLAAHFIPEGLQGTLPAGVGRIGVGPGGDHVDGQQRRLAPVGRGLHRDPLDPALPPCPVAPRRREGPRRLPDAARALLQERSHPLGRIGDHLGQRPAAELVARPADPPLHPLVGPDDLPVRPDDHGRPREELEDLQQRLRGHGITSPLDPPEDGLNTDRDRTVGVRPARRPTGS